MYVLSCGTPVQSRGYERKTSVCLGPSSVKILGTFSCSVTIKGCYYAHNCVGCFLWNQCLSLTIYSILNCTVLLATGECQQVVHIWYFVDKNYNLLCPLDFCYLQFSYVGVVSLRVSLSCVAFLRGLENYKYILIRTN